MSFAVERIDHVEVYVRDLGAACAWYDKVLGLKEVARWHPEPIMIGRGDTKLALFQALHRAPGGQPVEGCHWHRVAWLTDREGFEAASRHLAQLNVPVRGPVDHQSAWSLYFQDPDENLLEITCYL